MLDDGLIGCRVESFDHHPLGVVSGVDGQRMQLERKFGKPFWVEAITVRNVEGSVVTLHVDRKSLHRYRSEATHSRRRANPRTGLRLFGGYSSAALAVGLVALVFL